MASEARGRVESVAARAGGRADLCRVSVRQSDIRIGSNVGVDVRAEELFRFEWLRVAHAEDERAA